MRDGVSFVVCCHNGGRCLPETLQHLRKQRLSVDARYEVILVNNASTDDTVKVAQANWPTGSPIHLRIVSEPRLGLSHARLRGIAESQYSVICFVDDDNRLDDDWASVAVDIMAAHPEVGACGGQAEPAFEAQKPPWFDRFQSAFAVGAQAENSGDLTVTRGYLWGAGLCLRRSAWENLVENQFKFLLSGRTGRALAAGEDSELCFALRLSGWRLWYDSRLRMQHFILQTRLKWSYLRHLTRGFGTASATLDSYRQLLNGEVDSLTAFLRYSWLWQTLATFRRLIEKGPNLIKSIGFSSEGNALVLETEYLWGRFIQLLCHPREYASNVTTLRKLSRKQTDSSR